MTWRLFTASEVSRLHEAVLNDGELQGLAGNKSLEGALGRVEFRINYGMVNDVYDLAAMYAVAISQAHVFNDANKRTAHATMKACLKVHSVKWFVQTNIIGDKIREVAQGKVDETELADWLREQM
jgi:death-on-curing protein